MTHAPLLRHIERVALLLAAVVVVGWGVSVGLQAAASAAIGAAIGIANFMALRRIMGPLVAPSHDGASSRGAGGVLLLKFLVLCALIYLFVAVLGFHASAFAVGISVVALALVIESLRRPDLAVPQTPSPASDHRIS